MQHRFLPLFFSILAVMLALAPASFAAPKVSSKLMITSTSFKNRAVMPAQFAYGDAGDGFGVPGGQNLSPQLSWKTKRKDIKSYAILMWDKHPVAEKWVHWCVTGIPSAMTSFAEGYSTTLVVDGGEPMQLPNTYGFTAYGGPNPPKGSGVHEYEFWVVGLNTTELGDISDPSIGKAGSCGVNAFKKAIKGKALAAGKYVGKFKQ